MPVITPILRSSAAAFIVGFIAGFAFALARYSLFVIRYSRPQFASLYSPIFSLSLSLSTKRRPLV